MFIVIIALGTTDLLFALDSIPAIYGLTKEPYLVLTANLFALMGLRQLYFLIGGLLKRLVYLSIGLAVLLASSASSSAARPARERAAVHQRRRARHGAPDIPISVSLGAIVLILGVTTVASLWKSRKDERGDVGSEPSLALQASATPLALAPRTRTLASDHAAPCRRSCGGAAAGPARSARPAPRLPVRG